MREIRQSGSEGGGGDSPYPHHDLLITARKDVDADPGLRSGQALRRHDGVNGSPLHQPIRLFRLGPLGKRRVHRTRRKVTRSLLPNMNSDQVA